MQFRIQQPTISALEIIWFRLSRCCQCSLQDKRRTSNSSYFCARYESSLLLILLLEIHFPSQWPASRVMLELLQSNSTMRCFASGS